MNSQMLYEVLSGLRQEPKTLPCKFFYDERGSQLFDQICELDEYYPTRTETGILCAHAREMSALLGPKCLLIEFGSGSSLKTRILLDALRDTNLNPAAYVPIDIAGEHLLEAAAQLRARYPTLEISPLCADYTQSFELPSSTAKAARRAVYFPGSTIGNFHPHEAREFLKRIAHICEPGGGLLIGVDLKKDERVLEAAYNDKAGVTAAFNLNLLARLNRELNADFELNQFRHHAFYDREKGRIEMHLVSLVQQSVYIGGETILFEPDETIHTENSYKYALDEFTGLVESVGFAIEKVWTDAGQLFSVQSLSAR